MRCNRRTMLRTSIGLGTVAAFGGAARAQTATLSSMVFISKRLDASTADYRAWYINHHAPDFLSFARPYLTRYTQDFVERGRLGDVDFDCISEFAYRSKADLDTLQKTLATPEAQRTLAQHPKVGLKPGPHEDHGGSRTFSIDERLLSGPARGYDKPGTVKQAILLRRTPIALPESFATFANAYGEIIGRNVGEKIERIVLDVAVPEAGRPAPLFDGVIQIWPIKGADPLGFLTASPPAGVEVVNIVDLVSYESQLGAS